MNILGMGWATPFGRDLDTVWQRVRAGDAPRVETFDFPDARPVIRVPGECLADVARQPRLRRSSVLSHLAMAAAGDAVSRANVEDIAILFAATNGGVNYTRRFFADVAARGAHAGSPLLFPETVYNAPASHIAAFLGTDGICSSLVNDATAGIDVFAAAAELLDSGACGQCLVVGAEETDWIIGDAFERWSLVGRGGRIVPESGHGTICAEGAAAILLGRGSGPVISHVEPPLPFRSMDDGRRLAREFAGRHAAPEVVVSSMSGTRFDAVEAGLRDQFPARWLTPKVTLGEAFASSTIQQVICAALALRDLPSGARAVVLATGFNGQFGGLAVANP